MIYLIYILNLFELMAFYFNASEISALIGDHKYKSQDEAILIFLDRSYRYFMKNSKDKEGKNINLPLYLNNYQLAITSDDSILIKKAIVKLGGTDYIEKHIPNMTKYINEAAANQSNISDELIIELVEDINKSKNVLVENINVDDLKKTLEKSVYKTRGKIEEDTRLSKYNPEINERNTETRIYKTEEYTISGKRDGKLGDTIIELKTRKNWFKIPPKYDIIQLIVYMKIFNEKNGILIEQKQDNTLKRETKIEFNELKWNKIHKKLLKVIENISNITQDNIINIAKNI